MRSIFKVKIINLVCISIICVSTVQLDAVKNHQYTQKQKLAYNEPNVSYSRKQLAFEAVQQKRNEVQSKIKALYKEQYLLAKTCIKAQQLGIELPHNAVSPIEARRVIRALAVVAVLGAAFYAMGQVQPVDAGVGGIVLKGSGHLVKEITKHEAISKVIELGEKSFEVIRDKISRVPKEQLELVSEEIRHIKRVYPKELWPEDLREK